MSKKRAGMRAHLFSLAQGFTTKGAYVHKDVESLPNRLLFWHSFSHWNEETGKRTDPNRNRGALIRPHLCAARIRLPPSPALFLPASNLFIDGNSPARIRGVVLFVRHSRLFVVYSFCFCYVFLLF
jgi:hypothetical protein